MKQISSLLLLTLLFTVASAQNNDTIALVKPSNYIMDGTNPQFVWGNGFNKQVWIGVAHDQGYFLLQDELIVFYAPAADANPVPVARLHTEHGVVAFLTPKTNTMLMAFRTNVDDTNGKTPQVQVVSEGSISPVAPLLKSTALIPTAPRPCKSDTLALYQPGNRTLELVNGTISPVFYQLIHPDIQQANLLNVVDHQQEVMLSTSATIDENLMVFFFLYHYLPQTKQREAIKNGYKPSTARNNEK